MKTEESPSVTEPARGHYVIDVLPAAALGELAMAEA